MRKRTPGGARVATRFAKDYRDNIDRLAVLDNIPTRVILTTLNAERAVKQWFFLFNQIPDLPEALISGNEEIWLRYIYRSWCYNPAMMSDEEVAVYVKAYKQPGALRGACQRLSCWPRRCCPGYGRCRSAHRLSYPRPVGRKLRSRSRPLDVMSIWRGMAHMFME
jgi:haloacetate dehalogenase